MCLVWWWLVTGDSEVNVSINLSGESLEPCGEVTGLDDSGAGGLPPQVCQECNHYSLGCRQAAQSWMTGSKFKLFYPEPF